MFMRIKKFFSSINPKEKIRLKSVVEKYYHKLRGSAYPIWNHHYLAEKYNRRNKGSGLFMKVNSWRADGLPTNLSIRRYPTGEELETIPHDFKDRVLPKYRPVVYNAMNWVSKENSKQRQRLVKWAEKRYREDVYVNGEVVGYYLFGTFHRECR